MEQHVHTKNSSTTETDSYYPSQSGALHSINTVWDKYGRLKTIDGVLSNTYDILPTFSSSSGSMTTVANNASARLARSIDRIQGQTARFTYNQQGQLEKKTVTDSSDFSEKVSQEDFVYDTRNRLTKHTVTDKTDGSKTQAVIAYKKGVANPTADGQVSSYAYKVNGSQKAKTTNSYDDYNRLEKKTTVLAGTTFTRVPTNQKTRVSKLVHKGPSDTIASNTYSFDALGRISTDIYSSTYNNADSKSYVYDNMGQLVRENNKGLDKTYVYVYNEVGNLTTVKAYGYTTGTVSGTPATATFGYTDDKLTSFNGIGIAYNAMGCPTSYDGKTATWARGKLAKLSAGTKATGISNYTYGYNAYGQRVSRNYSYIESISGANPPSLGQVTGYSRSYTYDNAGRLISEKISKTAYGVGDSSEKMVFLYDDSGIIGMDRTANGATKAYYS